MFSPSPRSPGASAEDLVEQTDRVVNKETKRRSDAVEIFPNQKAFLCLATTVAMEQHADLKSTAP